MWKTFCVCVFLSVFVGFFGSAYGQFAKTEDAIELRKSAMTLIAFQFKKLAAVVKGAEPYDSAKVGEDANALKIIAGIPWEAFTMPGSDKGHTTMNAKALKDPGAFKAEVKEFMTAVDKLAMAAKSGNLKSLKAPFGETANTCKSCHDIYRSK